MICSRPPGLTEGGDALFDVGEGCFESVTAMRAGGALGEDAFFLQFERLAFAGYGCGIPRGLLLFRIGFFLMLSLCDLVFY